MTNSETTKIGFLIFPGFPMACLTSMIEPLRAANEITGQTAFEWVLISETGTRVEASAKVGFEPDIALADVDGLDQIILLSAPNSHFDTETTGNGQLRRLARHGVTMGAISGGVFPLARAGLLTRIPASVHWCYAAAFEAEFPDLTMTEDVVVYAKGHMTASGAAAAFDVALHMIEDRFGPEVATEVACWFQHPMVRGQGVAQRKPTLASDSTNDMLPRVVREAVAVFAENIEYPLKMTEVADQVGVSVRQFERMFRKTTGQSPLAYYRFMRMKAARQLVLYSKRNMSEIAQAVGFAASTPMIKIYVQCFGIHPEEDRKKVNMFRVRSNGIVPSA